MVLSLLEAQVWIAVTRLEELTVEGMSPPPIDPASLCVYNKLRQRMEELYFLLRMELKRSKETYRGGYIAALNDEVQKITMDSCWLTIRVPDAPDYQLAKRVVLTMKFYLKKE